MPFFDEELIFEGDTKTLGGVLQNFGNDLQEALRESLRKKTSSPTSKNLEQSITFLVKMQSLGVWRFRLSMADYADFIDQGVKGAGGVKKSSSIFTKSKAGSPWKQRAPNSPFRFRKKKPPLEKKDDPSAWTLKRWAESKGLSPFAVQESIFRQGIPPTRFYSDVVTPKLMSKLSESLARAGATDIELSVVDILDGTAIKITA